MPLTRQEQMVRVARFQGQRGRSPVGSSQPGQASYCDGGAFNASFLSRHRGSSKMTQAQIPNSGYELNGIATGILEIPAVEGFEGAWVGTFGTGQLGWGLSFLIQPLDLGGMTDSATGDGQVFFATATECGVNPSGGADINSVRCSFVISGGKVAVRSYWGSTTWDTLLQSDTAKDFDLSVPIWFKVMLLSGATNNSVKIGFSQVHPTFGSIFRSLVTTTVAQDWLVDQFWVGGVAAKRRPLFGIQNPCHCIVSEVVLRANNVPGPGSTVVNNAQTTWVRYVKDPNDPILLEDVWNLEDSTTEPVSRDGRKAYLVGNSVRRDSGITTQQQSSVRFDGTGMLVMRQSQRLREAPKPSVSGGVDGHYLELPAFSYALCIDPRRVPWRHPSVKRACFLNWTTPYAANLGVGSDPLNGSYPDSVRPSEHLRVEIEKISTTYYLRVYFGELEPESLKHPAGTAGGSSSTAWPPILSAAGEPPATWNKPQGDPTVAYTAGNGKTAFQIALGVDADATHPMTYSWWVFVQRKFVAQSDAGNACSVWVRRVKVDGTLDTAYGEVSDTNADGNGERHPANQSCFTAARLNASDVCFLPESYALSLGAAIGSQFGDEKKSYDGSTRLPSIYPVDGGDVPYQFSDEIDAFPFIGRVASIAFIKKYLLTSDRARIATAGAFTTGLRQQFRDDLLFSLNADELGGNVLREVRGADVAYADKIAVSSVLNDATIQVPTVIGCFPRPEHPWNNEVSVFPNEWSRVNAVVQRIDSGGREELYAVARPGLYQYDRNTHALTRVTTLPGQGGTGQCSAVVDNNDVIHIAGGPGRPSIITREKVVAVSGIDAPVYAAPTQIITAPKTIAGGMKISFQNKTDANPVNVVGYNIADTAVVQFAIGFWSDVLKTRSQPGLTVSCQFSSGNTNALLTAKYRLLVSGLPIPRGPNAALVTHWEIYRTDSNGNQLFLERRIPIGSTSPSTLIGDQATITLEADIFRSVAPEGMKAITVYGDRLVGVGLPEFPRGIAWTKRADSMNWPALYYTANLSQTNSPATGVVVRRDRCFAFSRDYLYQIQETGSDADPFAGLLTSLEITPLVEGAGCISHYAATTDHENGIYLPGNKTIYLTEGGTYRSVSVQDDSSAGLDGADFAWPDSWDLSDPDQFVAFHDERRRLIGICGPSAADPLRRDALIIYYEYTQATASGDDVLVGTELSRMIGIDMTCWASVLNQDSGAREVWFGTTFGHLQKLDDSLTIGVNYDWLAPVAIKMGLVMSADTPTGMRLDASFSGYPTSDLLRGSTIRVMRDGVVVSENRIIQSTVSASWVDVVLDGTHSAQIGDTWTAGTIPMRWISGKIDFGTLLQDKAIQSVDLTMTE